MERAADHEGSGLSRPGGIQDDVVRRYLLLCAAHRRSDSDYGTGWATRQSTVPEWQWLPEGSLSFWLQVDFSCTNYVQVPTQCGFVLFRR